MNLYELTRPQLFELVARAGFAAVHAARLWGYLYRQRLTDWRAMAELPARLRAHLEQSCRLDRPVVVRDARSADALARKYLLELAGGHRVETVLMRYRGRATACVSSQAGCASGCVFCATGQMGFDRNLTAGEIVAQALHVADAAADPSRTDEIAPFEPVRLRNLVLMGMGEPLLNYEAVMQAIDILRDPAGLAIGGKQITLSTVGVVPGIVRLADEGRPCSLAVSLHGVTQEERERLVPSARTWPLAAILDACRYYTDRTARKIFFEWTLIARQNDSPRHALALARLVAGMPAQVNVIPLNPTEGYSGLPGASDSVDRFREVLREHGVPSSVRQRRGVDIGAGCGRQLAV